MSKPPHPGSSDLAAYPRPNLAVDLVLLTICGEALQVMMMERGQEPYAGRLVLPGGFVHPDETTGHTARRILRCKTRLEGLPVEQLYSFSEPGRDPRGWVVSVAYFALVPSQVLLDAMDQGQRLRLVTVQSEDDAQGGDVVPVEASLRLICDGGQIEPGFDHNRIIATAVQRLRGKLDWSMAAFGLLPDEFTLFDLQRVHEVVLGRALLKSPFRKKMLDRTFPNGCRLMPTGRFKRAGRHRPAELYRLEPVVAPQA